MKQGLGIGFFKWGGLEIHFSSILRLFYFKGRWVVFVGGAK
jgi:hypothetical protein